MVTANSSRPKQRKLAFIVNTTIEKPDPKARQLIRSHVMRDKNRRKPPADGSKLKSWINEESSQRSVPVSDLYFPLPIHIGSGMPLVQLAYDMPPYALDLVYKCKSRLHVLCLDSVWIRYLAVDPLYCHSLLWTTQTYFDWLGGSGTSPAQILHAHRTLVGLRERLTDEERATSDSTVVVVVNLIMMNAVVGDPKSARKHMRGLHKMVEMRGGVRAFGGNTQIQLKMCRADLTMAMLSDRKPLFFSGGVCWEPYIAKNAASRKNIPAHMAGLDSNLLYIWADLREFSRSANLAFQTGQKIGCILYQEILISVQYRLLLLDVEAGSLDRLVLVGMLAFATNIFLQMQGLALRFANMSARLKGGVLGLQGLEDDAMVELKLWLLFIARMSDGATGKYSWIDAEMKKTLRALGVTKWEAAREKLKGYLWIDVMHDKGGKDAFEGATSSVLEPLHRSRFTILGSNI
ncbi:hypothetical protein LOCC1_G007048 [Lachnellula occidentalis]|uniref:Uncharacterized protein n=1 Tax=Lachnellula occidentalis TaxID=215460 RepID=A0A8H8S1F1_9HELO|nr:hypothetical protein LOCC1_G007048 [Lachnellula occidentalis]